jgi:hypothetical protein
MTRAHHVHLILIALVLAAVTIGVFLFTRHDRATNGTVHVALQIPASALTNNANLDAILKLGEVEVWSEQRGWRTIGTVREAVSLAHPPTSDHPFPILRANVKAGRYERIRITITSLDRADPEAPGAHLFNSSITLAAPLEVRSKETSAVVLTLQLRHSLYAIDSSPDLIFVPTISAETRVGVSVGADPFSIAGGTTVHNQTYGMRTDGSMRAQYRLPPATTFTAHQEQFVPTLALTEPSPVDLLLAQEALQETFDQSATTTPVAEEIEAVEESSGDPLEEGSADETERTS